MMRKLCPIIAMLLLTGSAFASALQLGVRWRSANALPGTVTALVEGDPDRDRQHNVFASVFSGGTNVLVDFEAYVDDLPIIQWKALPQPMDGGIQTMALEDYNGDGRQELLVVGRHQNNVVLLVYAHTGSPGQDRFDLVYSLTIPNGGTPVGVAVTNFNHNSLKEVTIASNLAQGAAIAIYESSPTPQNPYNLALLHVQAVVSNIQAFAVGDPDGNSPLQIPDQALWTVTNPYAPNPAPLTLYNLYGTAFSVGQITAGVGSGTAVGIFDADGVSGQEIVIARRSSLKISTLSFIRYTGGGRYSAPEDYILPTRFQSITSVDADVRGQSSSRPFIVLGLAQPGGVLVTKYNELQTNVIPYRSEPLGGATLTAIAVDPSQPPSQPTRGFDGDVLLDILLAVNNEIVFLEDNTLVYLSDSSVPRLGGYLRYQVKMPEIPNGVGHCFLSFGEESGCQRHPSVEGCRRVALDPLFHWTARGDPRFFENFDFTTNSQGESPVITVRLPGSPGPSPSSYPIYAQCFVKAGLLIRVTNHIAVPITA